MRAASDLAGMNAAKVLMRRAGYECAFSMALMMKDILHIDGRELVLYYLESTSKRGWGFSVVEEIDLEKGIFKGNLHFSPFVAGFPGGASSSTCDFQAGALEGIFAAAGNKNVRIVETQCAGKGDGACVFESKS
jgi:predicted hydrocarbon binding protein